MPTSEHSPSARRVSSRSIRRSSVRQQLARSQSEAGYPDWPVEARGTTAALSRNGPAPELRVTEISRGRRMTFCGDHRSNSGMALFRSIQGRVRARRAQRAWRYQPSASLCGTTCRAPLAGSSPTISRTPLPRAQSCRLHPWGWKTSVVAKAGGALMLAA
jgi:hypothetical protein